MRTLRRWTAAALIAGLCPGVSGQSLSQVGSFLEFTPAPFFSPSLVTGGSNAYWKTMTADGEWMLLVAGWSDLCTYSLPELALLRTDGTGFRVVVPAAVLKQLEPNPTTSWHMRTHVERLVLSGDGRWAAFMWPHNYSHPPCNPIGPIYWYIVNVETGHLEEFRFNDMPVGLLSYSDEGRLAFRGYDIDTGSYAYYVAEADGSDPVHVLDTSPWHSVIGMISPDARKLAFYGTYGFTGGGLADAYLLDLETRALTLLTPEPMLGIATVHPSHDASRVVIASLSGVWGVNGDGSELHLLDIAQTGSLVTLSRNGEYVFHRYPAENYNGWSFARTPWSGGPAVPIDGLNPAPHPMAPQPVSADGSRMVVHGTYKWGVRPWWLEGDGQLKVWHADPPVLTTYGYGTPGKPFTWEVGGEPGQLYAVQAEVQRGSGLPGLAATLPRWATGVLLTGVISGPDNIGSFTTTVPAFVPAGGELEILFRGWVLDDKTGETLPTNETRMLFTNPAGLGAVAESPPPPAPVADSFAAARNGPAWPPAPNTRDPFAGVSPERQLWELALADPQVWLRLKRGDWDGWTLESLALTLGVSAEDVALMVADGN